MYIVVFNYEVDSNRCDEYLKITREVIKPFWQDNGAFSYDVYQRYHPETGKLGNEFMKTQIMDGLPPTKEQAKTAYPPGADKIIDTFFSYAKNVTFKPYLKRI